MASTLLILVLALPAAAAVAVYALGAKNLSAARNLTLAAVLANLNTVLNHEYSGTDPRFCTVIFGLLTPDTDRGGFRITLASGGHPPALLMRADGTADYLPTPSGQLIGVLPDAQISTTSVHLAPGDTLLLHTDGLTEVFDAEGNEFGEPGVLGVLHRSRYLPLPKLHQSLMRNIEEFSSRGQHFADDVTILSCRFK